MHSKYIEQRHGGYYVAGTRISLDSVVYSFNEGQSPEAIQEDFPSLKRAQIYGAIAFYLDHQAEIDKYLVDTEREFEERDPAGTGQPHATLKKQHKKALATAKVEPFNDPPLRPSASGHHQSRDGESKGLE